MQKRSSLFGRYDLLLLLAIVVLFFLQFLMTKAQMEQLHVEDLAESVRSPYWWSQRTVFNGVSSSVGYYFLLSGAFKVFGYTLYMAKWVRLAMHLLSLVAIALLLKRWMGAKLALVPLLVAGSSPSWIFFNSNQAQFGIDLQFFPLLLVTAIYLPLKRGFLTYFCVGLLGTLSVWSALTYPTGLFYLPLLAAVVAWRWWKEDGNWRSLFWIGLAFAAGFVWPIVAALLYVKDPQLLIQDPVFKSGIFRGGGRGFTRRPHVIGEHYLVVLRDLFVAPNSYFFTPSTVEFGSWLGRLGFLCTAVGSLYVLAKLALRFQLRSWKTVLANPSVALILWLTAFALFFFNFPQFVATFPGLRRTTGFLFAYYGLVAYLWYLAFDNGRADFSKKLRVIFILGACFHLASNVISYERNLIFARGKDHRAGNETLFTTAGDPMSSLIYWEEQTRRGVPLRCEEFTFTGCRYPEMFGAIQGYRLWENKPPADIWGWDPYLKKNRVLELSIWEQNEWPNF